MNKYEYSKKELKEFTVGDTFAWKYVKDIQKEVVSHIIDTLIPNGNNAIAVPYPMDGYWYFPMPKKGENTRGYRSRLAAWTYLYIAENFTRRLNNEEELICELIFPDEIPWFCLEGFAKN